MKLEEISEKIEYVKYKISKLVAVTSSENIDIKPEFVSELLVEYDYDNLYAPVMTLSIALTQVEYRKIVLDKANVKFIIQIDKHHYDDTNTFLYKDTFINDTFCSHITDETPIMEEKLLEITKQVNGKDDIEDREPTDMKDVYDFALFIESDVQSGNSDVNMLVKSGNMTDVIAYVLQSAGLSNVLMTPPDNNASITNIVFPLMNVIEFFNYLQSNIGIYKNGLSFFMDYNTNYFIDKSAYCSAWRPNEYKITNFYVLSQKSQYNTIIGQYVDDEKRENNIFTNSEATNIVNKSVVNNPTFGNKKVLLQPKQNSINYIDPKLKQRGGSITSIEIQKKYNSYTSAEYKMRLIENEFDIDVVVKDIDIELLSPNKCFKMIFQTSDLNDNYGGTYRISHTTIVMTKMGDELDSYIICEMKKQNNYANEFGGEDNFDDWFTEALNKPVTLPDNSVDDGYSYDNNNNGGFSIWW